MIIKERVPKLWEHRIDIAHPKKIKRLTLFYEIFEKLCREWLDGKRYTDDKVMQTDYFKYLQGYHKSWQEVPLSERAKKQIIWRWREGRRLLFDIKEKGMKDPIEMITDERKRTYIYKGNRRLTILKVLGIEIADVDYK